MKTRTVPLLLIRKGLSAWPWETVICKYANTGHYNMNKVLLAYKNINGIV